VHHFLIAKTFYDYVDYGGTGDIAHSNEEKVYVVHPTISCSDVFRADFNECYQLCYATHPDRLRYITGSMSPKVPLDDVLVRMKEKGYSYPLTNYEVSYCNSVLEYELDSIDEKYVHVYDGGTTSEPFEYLLLTEVSYQTINTEGGYIHLARNDHQLYRREKTDDAISKKATIDRLNDCEPLTGEIEDTLIQLGFTIAPYEYAFSITHGYPTGKYGEPECIGNAHILEIG
jgi:hypothetical protein